MRDSVALFLFWVVVLVCVLIAWVDKVIGGATIERWKGYFVGMLIISLALMMVTGVIRLLAA